jgi:hypothetical protein
MTLTFEHAHSQHTTGSGPCNSGYKPTTLKRIIKIKGPVWVAVVVMTVQQNLIHRSILAYTSAILTKRFLCIISGPSRDLTIRPSLTCPFSSLFRFARQDTKDVPGEGEIQLICATLRILQAIRGVSSSTSARSEGRCARGLRSGTSPAGATRI